MSDIEHEYFDYEDFDKRLSEIIDLLLDEIKKAYSGDLSDPDACEHLVGIIREKYGYEFSLYGPTGLKRRIFERDEYRCRVCGGWRNLALDHIIPKSKGGRTVESNLQTLCKSCNSTKGTKLMDEQSS